MNIEQSIVRALQGNIPLERTKAEELIQAAYHTGGPDTREREIKALVEAGEELKCGKLTVLTWNREEKHSARGVEINFVPVWKWLIGGSPTRTS